MRFASTVSALALAALISSPALAQEVTEPKVETEAEVEAVTEAVEAEVTEAVEEAIEAETDAVVEHVDVEVDAAVEAATEVVVEIEAAEPASPAVAAEVEEAVETETEVSEPEVEVTVEAVVDVPEAEMVEDAIQAEAPEVTEAAVEAVVETIEPEVEAATEEAVEEAVEAEEIQTIQEAEPEETEVSELSEPKLLLMPAKAEVMFITTGGSELRADWSEAAQVNLTTHLDDYVSGMGVETVKFDGEAETSEELEQLLLLADVVRNSAALNLPHKPKTKGNNLLSGNNRVDITLGEDAALLKEAYGADQVLFLDHYSQIESGGVFMAQVLIGAATGYVPVSQNFRGTVATVIDLETGKISSRNFATMGDSRDVEESKGIVSRVMNKIDLQ